MKQFAQNKPVVFVVGAMAHGKVIQACCSLQMMRIGFLNAQVEVDYTEQEIAISQYPLSAALTCTKICSAFEQAWNIV